MLSLALSVALLAPPPIRCVAVAPHFEGEATVDRLADMVKEIKGLGANTLMVVVQWGQADVTSVDLGPYQWGTDDEKVTHLVTTARGLGLDVLIFPIVRLAEIRPSRWRGRLAPVDRARWWRSYTAFLLHYARLGAKSGATLFSVGSELGSMERDEARWRAVIAQVRGVFPGRLIYAANWDHFAHVGFWDALDLVGVNAYHPITNRDDASEADLAAVWRVIRGWMTWWTAQVGRPLLFTELGYPSVDGGARRPYHYAGDGALDLAEQARAYGAFVSTWQDEPQLAGACVWIWTGTGGPTDNGYMLRGKPAEATLRQWFMGAP